MATGETSGNIVIECPQQIPCNPCVDACRFGAIQKEGLNGLPHVDRNLCTGCKLCVAACPSQAIFYIEETPDGVVCATFPYEYRPLPALGQRVTAVDAEGQALGAATVVKVAAAKAYNSTPLITVSFAGPAGRAVRSIRRSWEEEQHG